ncbi:metallophosphoesterase family protein [Caulobacter sp. S45]|uniref:metallophosphoesterase family protein n=1 Tax=Caulobacter sp. S45 TaxID=1641861 RepID=UPI001576BCD9|nr:metallophosphoesterase family protein [Caulobacter sp. S45]
MLNFFQRKKAPVLRSAPDGVRLYAVGDVHGRLDALDPLVAAIRSEPADGLRPVLIMLGDYVDRGPASRGVIDLLISLQDDAALETRFIRGNHEETMLRFLEEPPLRERSVGATWCSFGGVETLASYGVAAPSPADPPQAWEAARAAFAAAIPATHVRFLQALEPAVEYGDYFFTHAGVRPGVELDQQDPQDLMWIRDEFLRGSAVFSKAIVHGHTPEADAFVSDRRIGVDTGAYVTGRLSAIVLEGPERRLIQAQVSGGRTFVDHIDIAPG